MVTVFRAGVVSRVVVTVLLALPLTAAVGCGPGEPERTEDPAEIEEKRQEHLDQAARERQEAR